VRKHGRVDCNHTRVVAELRAAGFSVLILAALGHGIPDLLVGKNGHMLLVEIKKEPGPRGGDPGSLTPDQVRWISEWKGGRVLVAHSAHQVISHFESLYPS
jgi:Holliday junction resolvase